MGKLGPVCAATGSTVRVMLFNREGLVRDVISNLWDVWDDDDIDDYGIQLLELGTSGIYYGDAPAGIDVDASEFDTLIYLGDPSLANIRSPIGRQKSGVRDSNILAVNDDTVDLEGDLPTAEENAAAVRTELSTELAQISAANAKLNAGFVQLVSANSHNKTIDDLTTPKNVNIKVD